MSEDNLLELIEQLDLQAARDYWALVKELADSKPADAEHVRRTLWAARKSTDDLKADIDVQRQRRQWRALLDTLPDIERREQEIRAELAKADAALEKAEKRHAEAVAPLLEEMRRLDSQREEARTAKRKLLQTCRAPDIVAAAADLEQRRKALERQRTEAMDNLAAVETDLGAARWEAEKPRAIPLGHPEPRDRERAQEMVKRLEAKKAELESELATLNEQANELDRERDELERRMLNP